MVRPIVGRCFFEKNTRQILLRCNPVSGLHLGVKGKAQNCTFVGFCSWISLDYRVAAGSPAKSMRIKSVGVKWSVPLQPGSWKFPFPWLGDAAGGAAGVGEKIKGVGHGVVPTMVAHRSRHTLQCGECEPRPCVARIGSAHFQVRPKKKSGVKQLRPVNFRLCAAWRCYERCSG